jgi:hypothetical protein
MNEVVKLINGFDPSLVVLAVMSIIIVVTVISWHFNDSKFHLQQLIVDNVSEKLSIEKTGYMTALAVATWIMITLTIYNKMTEGYLAGYLSIFALSRAASSLTSVWKDKAVEPPKEPPKV